MTFLDPASGLIAGAIAVPLLVALYLLKLRRKPLRVSSTLLWEQAVKDVQANVPLRWLRFSWLLVLQVLGLLALVAALARPAVPGAADVGGRRVLVIDASASMSATDGVRAGGATDPVGVRPAYTRLDQAKNAARRVVDDLSTATNTSDGRRPEAMVVALADQARAMTGFTSDPRRLREAIDAILPTDQPANLQNAFDLCRAMTVGIDDEQERTPEVGVVVFSDGSFLHTTAGIAALPAGVRAQLVGVGPPDAQAGGDNLGIVAIAAQRDVDEPAKVRLFVRVQNASANAVRTAITLNVNGEASGVKPVEVPARTGESAGEASVTFEFTHPGPALLSVLIPREDRLSSDNTAVMTLPGVRLPRVIVVGPGVDPADPHQALRGSQGVDRFLLAVLREIGLGSLVVMSIENYTSAYEQSGGVIDADLLIFDRATPPPAALPARVASLHIGAGVPSAAPERRVLVEAFGKDDAGGQATRFVLWHRQHALLRSIPLDGVLIWPAMRVTLPAGDSCLVLAEGDSGPLMVLLQPGVPGEAPRLVLGFDLIRTNWGGDVSFPVFVASAVESLASMSTTGGMGSLREGTAYSTTQSLWVDPAPGAQTVSAQGPERREVPADQAGGYRVNLGVLTRAGVYELEGVDASRSVARVGINLLSPHESMIATAPRLGQNAVQAQADSSGTVDDGGSRRAGGWVDGGRLGGRGGGMREIWPLFVLVGAGLLCVEWVLYAWSVRS